MYIALKTIFAFFSLVYELHCGKNVKSISLSERFQLICLFVFILSINLSALLVQFKDIRGMKADYKLAV